ncbi:hypothetical protein [Phenylobacterium sp.]|uniref:hypothetical protein n=1 Tax=Phenylobacterium sp. TaxID=1871053 RepID=UPI0037C6A4C0
MAQALANSTVRVAASLANGFALDLVKLGGFGKDVIDGLPLLAISQANVMPVSREPELQRAYASLDQTPPDDLRRPVSINAIPSSLRVPYETARRRIMALINSGILQPTPKGVILPQAPLNSAFYRMSAEGNYNLVRTLYFRLRGIGLLTDLARPNSLPFEPEHPPVRLVIRMSADYLLRLAEFALANQGHLQKLFSGLAEFGVLLEWDRELDLASCGATEMDCITPK